MGGMRKKGQGYKWIRVSTRMAIYARDGFRCVYCGHKAKKNGVGLSLDHLVACEAGGTNRPDNLVSACISCNSAKQDATIRQFFAKLRAERGVDTTAIGRRIRRLVRKPLNRGVGRVLAAKKAA